MAKKDDENIEEDVSQLQIDGSSPSSFPSIKTETVRTTTSFKLNVKDITGQFSKATSGLDTSQLVKDEWFTLFESVGALEIMDPKMDSGYLKPGESLDDEYQIMKDLSLGQTLGIIDKLLCHEMAWHMGHPLSQTLFTSHYLDHILFPTPKDLQEAHFGRRLARNGSGYGNPLLSKILRSYCLATIKTCQSVHQMVISEHYYEEEDFVSNLYNRELLPWLTYDQVIESLDDSMAWLTTNSISTHPEIAKALWLRLDLRKTLLSATEAKFLTGENQAVIDAWKICKSLLPKVLDTTVLGEPVPDSFSAKIQRRLASTVPPRPIVYVSFDDAIYHLSQLCDDAKVVLQMKGVYGAVNKSTSVWRFISRRPRPSVYARALLQSKLFDPPSMPGAISVKQLIIDELRDIVIPIGPLLDPKNEEIEVPTDPRFLINARMNEFISRVGQTYLDMYRCLSQNRSRIRRMLCHSIQDWDNIQQFDALDFDREFDFLITGKISKDHQAELSSDFPLPLSSWVYHHKLLQMSWIIQLGFELDIYQPDELASMYLQLSNTGETHLNHLQYIRSTLVNNVPPNPSDVEKAAVIRSIDYIKFLTLQIRATQSFAYGLSCLYTLLMRFTLIPIPPRPYSTDVWRYELRMKPFLSIAEPPLLPYPLFDKLVKRIEVSDGDLLQHAIDTLKHAKQGFDLLSKMDAESSRSIGCYEQWKTDVKNQLRACIAASIALATISKAMASKEVASLKVELPVAVGNDIKSLPKGIYHEWWIVPTIKTL